MKIYDSIHDKKIKNIILYLTETEASELKDSLERLLANKGSRHEHIPDEDFIREVTVCTYRKDHLEEFDERSKRIILEDE